MSLPFPSGLFTPSPRKILKVGELTSALRDVIEQGFNQMWVEGEVANLRIPQSGHCYFTLKDETTQIKAVRFRSYLRAPQFLPKEGDLILILGHLTVYEARGEYQIVVDYMEPRGIGALLAAFEALKERLRIEGLFDVIHKKPIPVLPKRIALITSPTGAVLQDFLKILRERETALTIFIVPVPVQGASAAREIATALSNINHNAPSHPIDLIVIARGGGSLEDLWAFNDESLARTIFQSKIPVITAIGHETDTTIADLVADLRAPTPSVAAEIVARAREAPIERFHQINEILHRTMQTFLERRRHRLNLALRFLMAPQEEITHFRNMTCQYFYRNQAAMTAQMQRYRNRLQLMTQRLHAKSPVALLTHAHQTWERLSDRLRRLGMEIITQRKDRVATTLHQLDLLSPLNILGRGYSIAERLTSRKIVRDAAEVALEEMLYLRLHQGGLLCLVKEKTTP